MTYQSDKELIVDLDNPEKAWEKKATKSSICRLSKEAHVQVQELKEITGERYSIIIEKALKVYKEYLEKTNDKTVQAVSEGKI